MNYETRSRVSCAFKIGKQKAISLMKMTFMYLGMEYLRGLLSLLYR